MSRAPLHLPTAIRKLAAQLAETNSLLWQAHREPEEHDADLDRQGVSQPIQLSRLRNQQRRARLQDRRMQLIEHIDDEVIRHALGHSNSLVSSRD